MQSNRIGLDRMKSKMSDVELGGMRWGDVSECLRKGFCYDAIVCELCGKSQSDLAMDKEVNAHLYR